MFSTSKQLTDTDVTEPDSLPAVTAPSSAPAPVPDVLVSRPGRPTLGIYPEISRTKLANLLGCSKSWVTWMLRGQRRIPLRVAIPMAKAIGIGVEQLQRDWDRERRAGEAAQAEAVSAQAEKLAGAKKSKRQKSGKSGKRERKTTR